jgi:uncharacterized protein YkwD
MIRTTAFALGTLCLFAGPVSAGGPDWIPLYLTDPLWTYPMPPWLDEAPLATRGAGASFEEQVLELVNVERLNNGGLAPLKGVAPLNGSAETHSSNMGTRNFFSHCDLDTLTDPVDRMVAAGYSGMTTAAENIAAGYTTPANVMAGWMASAGHRANILGSFREIGIGYVLDAADSGNVRMNPDPLDCTQNSTSGPFLHYWTQNFGSRLNVYPVVIEREAYETASANVDLYLYGSGWATEMRIRNETGSFGAFQPFATNVAWQLSAGDGLKTVLVEIRNAAMTVLSASDTINLTGQADAIFGDGFETGNTSAWDAVVP